MLANCSFKPLYDKDSKILILGSFPSKKSLELGFYYANPQNRFWNILGGIFNEDIPKVKSKMSKEECKSVFKQQKAFLLRHNIAIWDVAKVAKNKSSLDSTLEILALNDISQLCKDSKIKAIFTVGKKATELYKKFHSSNGLESKYLPSSSSANAGYNLESLKDEWSKIKQFL